MFVTFDGCDIPDSPFRILVGKVDADPGMVTASGDGLRTGQTGRTNSRFRTLQGNGILLVLIFNQP